jgi:hypothetical protein
VPAMPDDLRAEARLMLRARERTQSLSAVLIMPEANPMPEPPADAGELADRSNVLPDTGAGALAAIMDRYRKGLL